jgi:hypothetical protein
MSTPGYETVTPLERKAIEAFKWMGFDVESKRVIAGHSIDIFIKRKKIFQDQNECWLCFCDQGDRKVGKRKVEHLYPVREAVWSELKKQTHDYIYDDCQLMIISEKGFTKGADEVARMHGIVLETLDSLFSQLVDLKKPTKD